MRTATLTVLALLAFAANSVLCRLALRGASIDAATFSTIRLTSGAAVLVAMTWLAGTRTARPAGSWLSALFLFLYAVPFSFAYNWLTTGTGALILFGSVQITMLSSAVYSGERLKAAQWTGVVAAVGGLVVLVLPGLAAPSAAGASLMTIAGVAWGVYSLRGRGVRDPLGLTAGTFARTVPLVLLVNVFNLGRLHVVPHGAMLAVASGAVTSGLGYVIWYAALRTLSTTRASVVQLIVPVLAAAGGVVFLGELLTFRLLVSTVMVVGGIGAALTARRR